MKNSISLFMMMLFLVMTSLSVSAQSNTYNKRDVMAQISNLDQTNLNFVEDQFDQLNNREVLAFIKKAATEKIVSANAIKMRILKTKATSAEYEGLIGDFSEAKMNFLFNKYSI